jgi:hypothetical protein
VLPLAQDGRDGAAAVTTASSRSQSPPLQLLQSSPPELVSRCSGCWDSVAFEDGSAAAASAAAALEPRSRGGSSGNSSSGEEEAISPAKLLRLPTKDGAKALALSFSTAADRTAGSRRREESDRNHVQDKLRERSGRKNYSDSVTAVVFDNVEDAEVYARCSQIYTDLRSRAKVDPRANIQAKFVRNKRKWKNITDVLARCDPAILEHVADVFERQRYTCALSGAQLERVASTIDDNSPAAAQVTFVDQPVGCAVGNIAIVSSFSKAILSEFGGDVLAMRCALQEWDRYSRWKTAYKLDGVDDDLADWDAIQCAAKRCLPFSQRAPSRDYFARGMKTVAACCRRSDGVSVLTEPKIMQALYETFRRQSGRCYVTGIALAVDTTKVPSKASPDRLRTGTTHARGNFRMACHWANQVRGTMSLASLEGLLRQILVALSSEDNIFVKHARTQKLQ